MTVQKIGLSIVIASALLTGCGGMITSRDVALSLAEETSSSECRTYTAALKVWNDTTAQVREEYMEEYFDSIEYKSFESGYWRGFWSEHKYCKICNEIGNVPEEYVLKTQEED